MGESAGLKAQAGAKHRRIRSLKLTVIVRDAKARRTTLTQAIRRLGL